MALYTIGDTHLSLAVDKPMDVFAGWDGYLPRLEQNWRRLVSEEDTVVIPGDISWAMRLEDCRADFAFLHSLPGKKLLLKGNHDYWWTTRAKMDKFLAANGFDSLRIVHNDSVQAEGFAICGSRSWMFDSQEEQDEKVMARELGRLRASLAAAGQGEKLVFLHYPPVYPGARADGVVELLREFGVKQCFYGHLHGSAIRFAVQGWRDEICYKLVSADALEFCPWKIS